MFATIRKACPFCLMTLVGVTLLICIPGLAKQPTPMGNLAIWLVWLPTSSALLRAGLLYMARGV